MRLASSLACALATLWVQSGTDPESGNSPCRLVLLDRQISQHAGEPGSQPARPFSRWVVRYQVRYEGDTPLDLSASDLCVDYEAWVSNSRAKPHTTPRRSQTRFALSETSSIQTTVIPHSNDRSRCREKISLAITTGDKPAAEPSPAKTNFIPLHLAPGQTIWLYLTLEHDHFLYGTYDPLLGARQLEICLGPCRLIDSIPLDTEQAPAIPLVRLSAPPKERLDQRQFHSAPDSLYLAADVPGYQYFRFDDMPVRYGTQFKLSFWYLIAVGTEGNCQVRVMEYQDTPNAWYRLDGGFDEQMAVQGRWHKFEQSFQTRDETTTMALDFRLVGANVGEMWVDDVELVPLFTNSDARRVSPRIDRQVETTNAAPNSATRALASDRP